MARVNADDDNDDHAEDQNADDASGVENTPNVQAGNNSIAIDELYFEGNVSGPFIIGNGNQITQILRKDGVIVDSVPPSKEPLYSMRTSPVSGIPLDAPLFLDRDEALDAIKTVIQTSRPVSIFGEKGIGKTSLVRYLLHHAELPTSPNDILYVDASAYDLDDLLQNLFDRFCTSLPAFKPKQVDLLEALQQPNALIFIDHLKLGQKEMTSLRNTMPGCTFILASIEPSLPGESQKVSLKGLPDEEAVTLFVHELASFVNANRSLNKKEQAAVGKLCALYQGNPSLIVSAADRVAQGDKSIFQLLEESERGDPDTVLLQAALSPLAENKKQVLSILAAVGGSKLPLEHLVVLSRDPDILETLQELITLRLIQVDSGKYSLTGNLASALAALEDLSIWEDRLLDYFTHWLEGKPAQERIEEAMEALLYLQKKASEKQKWSRVVPFGLALEPGLILSKRWQAWAELLNHVRDAAKALGDSKVEAWALHQQGSRAMFLGQEDQARELLTQALNLRKAIRDKGGVEVTQHNLNVLLPTPVPSGSGGLSSGWMGSWIGAGWLIGGIALAAVGVLLFSLLRRPDNPAIAPSIELTATIPPPATMTAANTPTVANTLTPIPTKPLTPQGPITYGPDLDDFPSGISPLTGSPACDPSLLEFPAVLVSISHFPASARPQAGLSFSSMVFDIYIGTGTTRFLAVFYGDCPHATVPGVPDEIGPVRSGRVSYKQIREFFQGSCLAFAGADDPTFEVLPVCKIVYTTGDVNSALLSIADLQRVARENPRRDQPFNYSGNMFSDSSPSGELSLAENISVFYNYLNQAQWRYNASSGKYLRFVNGATEKEANQFTPATDRLTGEQLAYSNIIVMLAQHIVKRPEAIDINMAINSFGNAYLFRDGKVFEIRWTAINGEYEKETGRRRPIRFTDAEGNPIPLKPGNTWIHLMSRSSRVKPSGDKWEARFSAPD